jgi:hypothetical protein
MPRLIWENVESEADRAPDGYLIFDDIVLDKNYSFSIELVRRQYRGNAHNVIKGSGEPAASNPLLLAGVVL